MSFWHLVCRASATIASGLAVRCDSGPTRDEGRLRSRQSSRQPALFVPSIRPMCSSMFAILGERRLAPMPLSPRIQRGNLLI